MILRIFWRLLPHLAALEKTVKKTRGLSAVLMMVLTTIIGSVGSVLNVLPIRMQPYVAAVGLAAGAIMQIRNLFAPAPGTVPVPITALRTDTQAAQAVERIVPGTLKAALSQPARR